MQPKFNVGDKVKIVNYGHVMWYMKGESILKGDLRKDLLGKEGIVIEINDTQVPYVEYSYSVNGLGAWFNEDQLELI